MNRLVFQRGQVSDALSILTEAALWLHDRGDPSWTLPEFGEDQFLTRYKKEDIIVGYTHGIPVCTSVLMWSDPDFWPHISANTSGFLHKLAIRRAYAGQGYIQELLTYVMKECQAKDISTLRLDVDSSRNRLCKYYESLGFIFLDTVYCIGYRVNRYELYF